VSSPYDDQFSLSLSSLYDNQFSLSLSSLYDNQFSLSLSSLYDNQFSLSLSILNDILNDSNLRFHYQITTYSFFPATRVTTNSNAVHKGQHNAVDKFFVINLK
jgi:hypothetical protein